MLPFSHPSPLLYMSDKVYAQKNTWERLGEDGGQVSEKANIFLTLN